MYVSIYVCIYALTDIPHRDVPNHLQSNTQEHLMLAVMRIVEQQDVISNLNNKARNNY